MQTLIKLNREDIRRLISKTFDVETSDVEINVDEATGLFSFKTYTITAYVDITKEKGIEDADIQQ